MQIDRKWAYVKECVCVCGSWFRIIMFCVMRSNDSFNFPLGLIKYIVVVVTVVTWHDFFRTGSTLIIPQQRHHFQIQDHSRYNLGMLPREWLHYQWLRYQIDLTPTLPPPPFTLVPVVPMDCESNLAHTVYTPTPVFAWKGRVGTRATGMIMQRKPWWNWKTTLRPGIPLLTRFSEMRTVCVHARVMYHYCYFRQRDPIVLYSKSMCECAFLFYSSMREGGEGESESGEDRERSNCILF